MDEVAERAGVSKATIYRWWPSKELLALDALSSEWDDVLSSTSDQTGSLRDDLRARADAWLPVLQRKPIARAIAGLVAEAQANPEFAKLYVERFHQPRRAMTRQVLERAIARGEIRADLDLELALDLLYGPFWHRLLHGHAPLDERFAYAAIDLFIAAIE